MSQTLVDTFLQDAGAMLEPLSVDQYHRMLETGVLAEGAPIELIDGLLVRKDRRDSEGGIMTVGPRHSTVISILTKKLVGLCDKLVADLRIQQPLTLTDRDEPEPDLALVRGTDEDYLLRHPEPGDVELVIEVADSSLAFDRGRKLALYAAAGVPTYVVINLRNDTVETHTVPNADDARYVEQSVASPGETVIWTLCGQPVQLAASELLGK